MAHSCCFCIVLLLVVLFEFKFPKFEFELNWFGTIFKNAKYFSSLHSFQPNPNTSPSPFFFSFPGRPSPPAQNLFYQPSLGIYLPLSCSLLGGTRLSGPSSSSRAQLGLRPSPASARVLVSSLDARAKVPLFAL